MKQAQSKRQRRKAVRTLERENAQLKRTHDFLLALYRFEEKRNHQLAERVAKLSEDAGKWRTMERAMAEDSRTYLGMALSDPDLAALNAWLRERQAAKRDESAKA